MPNWGKVDFKDWERLNNKLKRLEKVDLDKFCRDVSKELAARLLSHLIKRTPVAENTKTHKGGTLRRGWTGGVQGGASAYAAGCKVRHVGDTYQILLMNPVEYGIYVNYGHRTVDHKGWVPGKYFVELAVDEVEQGVERIIEKKLDIILKGLLA